jgi:ABC-2 type transport system permease protein
MLRKLFVLFFRELKSAMRDSMSLVILIMPILMAAGILLFAPGVNDTTVNLAVLNDGDQVHIEYMEQYAKVERFDALEKLEERVTKRDDVVGLVSTGEKYDIIIQGNEPQQVEDYAVLLQSLFDLGTTKEDTTAIVKDFGHTVSPLKTMLVNMLISMIVMMSGMLIAIGIVEEKSDNTINALNVTPISQTGFVIGKSMTAAFTGLVSIVVALIITGYADVNWAMILITGFMSMLLSFIIGFVQGLASDDIIEAATNVKMVMIPVAGSIAGYELLADKWQWTMYWSPFYWAYKANLEILSKTAEWGFVLMCAGIVLGLTLVMFLISKTKIRDGLS